MTTGKPRREKPKESTGGQTNILGSSSLVNISSNMLSQYPQEGNLILSAQMASQKIMGGMWLSPGLQTECHSIKGGMVFPPFLEAEYRRLMGGMVLPQSIAEALAKMGAPYPRPNIPVVRETQGYMGVLAVTLKNTSFDRFSDSTQLLANHLTRKEIPRIKGMLAYLCDIASQVQTPAKIESPPRVEPDYSRIAAVSTALALEVTKRQVEELSRLITKLMDMMEEKTNASFSIQAKLSELPTIKQKLDQVLEKGFELSAENQKLNEALHNGLLRILEKIGVHNAQYICAILVHGDISKAARALNIKDSTLRHKLNHLEGQGISVDKLRRLIKWRKKLGAIRTVPYNDNLDTGQSAPNDYAELLRDILSALESVSKDNWHHVCAELTSIIRSEIL